MRTSVPRILLAPLAALLVVLALSAGPVWAAGDAGDAIGGVNIGERKDEIIDDRLSCAAGGAAEGGLIAAGALVGAALLRTRLRRGRASSSTRP